MPCHFMHFSWALILAGALAASATWAADNLTIKEPAAPSATVRSDDVGGVHYQGFKIYDGEADSSTPLELTPAQDYDTGGGTANLSGFGIFLPASGGPVPGGTAAAPLRIDPTGTTTQPVSDAGGSLTVDGSVTADTELPAGVTPADNQTNAVTLPLVGGFAYVFDGTTWDRARGDSTDGVLVNLGANNDITGTVTANQGGAPWSENISQFGGNAVQTGVGVAGTGVPRVTLSADAHDSPITERGTRISGRASAAAPTNVSADDDNVSLWALRNGQLVQQPAFSGTLATTGSGASGGGTQRVILATDQPVIPVSDNSTTLSVDDGAGSLTIDGTVGVSGTVTVDTEFANQTNGAAAGATGIQVLGSDGTNARIVKTDAGGAVQIDCESGCGGGTQFAEDIGHTTGDLGTMALAVRNDAGGPLSGTTLDYTPLQTDANGALRVTGGGGGTEYTEDAVSATDPIGGQVMARRRDTLATETTTDGDVTALNATGKGELYVKQTDAVPVTDNGGSLTVDGTVTANAGSGTFTVGDGGGSLTVDNGGTFAVQPGDNKAEDAAHASADNGSFVLAVRNDAAATTFGANGDYSPIAVDGNGRVGIADLGGTISIDDNASTISVDDGAGSLTVDGTVAVSGTVTVDSELPAAETPADNLANGTAAPRVNALAYGFDGTAWDRLPGDSTNGLRVDLGANNDVTLTSGTLTTITNAVTVSQATAANLNAEVQGDAAHDAAVSGNPVLGGAEARTSDGTPVGSGDAVRAQADTLGKQVVLIGAVNDLQVNGTVNEADTTADNIIAAGGAGVRTAVMSCTVTNAHATVGTKVEIRDGTTVKIQGYAAAAGGGFSMNGGGTPLFISTANTAVTARNVTTGADVDFNCSGYKMAN